MHKFGAADLCRMNKKRLHTVRMQPFGLIKSILTDLLTAFGQCHNETDGVVRDLGISRISRLVVGREDDALLFLQHQILGDLVGGHLAAELVARADAFDHILNVQKANALAVIQLLCPLLVVFESLFSVRVFLAILT